MQSVIIRMHIWVSLSSDIIMFFSTRSILLSLVLDFVASSGLHSFQNSLAPCLGLFSTLLNRFLFTFLFKFTTLYLCFL